MKQKQLIQRRRVNSNYKSISQMLQSIQTNHPTIYSIILIVICILLLFLRNYQDKPIFISGKIKQLQIKVYYHMNKIQLKMQFPEKVMIIGIQLNQVVIPMIYMLLFTFVKVPLQSMVEVQFMEKFIKDKFKKFNYVKKNLTIIFHLQMNRSFQKIGALLSYLGGVVQIMKLAFGLFIALYQQHFLLNSFILPKKFLPIQQIDKENSQITNDKEQSRQPSVPNTNRSRFVEDQKSPVLDAALGINNIETPSCNPLQRDIKTAVTRLLENPNPIKFSFRLFLNMITCGTMFKDKNAIFLSQGIKRMNQDLDLLNILYKIQ